MKRALWRTSMWTGWAHGPTLIVPARNAPSAVATTRCFASQASDSSALQIGRWKAFASEWNSTLARRPQELIASYLAVQSVTWLSLYKSLSASGIALPPELAAGWLCSRLTRKFRQPINVAMAACVVKLVPAVSDLKVSPLVTGFAPDEATRQELKRKREEMEEQIPQIRPLVQSVKKGANFLQGPVDKYGLSLFLSGKASALATMATTSILIGHGVDVQTVLASWGLSDSLGEAAGTLAGSSACNAFLTPLHFYAAVYGVRSMEGLAGKLVMIKSEALQDDYPKEKADSSGTEETTVDEVDSILKGMGMFLIIMSFGISMFALGLMGKKAVKAEKDEKTDTTALAAPVVAVDQ